jgi:hypothetical protein
MRKWLLSMVLFFGLVPFGWAGQAQILRGPVMALSEEGSIVVNKTTIALTSSTTIADEGGGIVDFGELKRGQWVSVEVEPEGGSGMAAKKIILLQQQTPKTDGDRRFARVLIVLWLLAAHKHPG